MNRENSNKTAVEKYFTALFQNFGSFLLLNVLFFVPSAVFTAGFYMLSLFLTGGINVFIVSLSIIPLTPFYLGLCSVCMKIISNKKNGIFKDFIKGVKENFKIAVPNGFLLYAVFNLLFLALFTYYSWGVNYSNIYFIFFCTTLVVAIAALFFLFGVFVMSVSFELKLTQIYKNSLLAIFGELKNNLISLLGILCLGVVLYILILFPGDITYCIVMFILLYALFIPSAATLTYFIPLYESMVNVVGKKDEKKQGETKSEITNDELLKNFENLDKTGKTNSNGDEYIYYNGRMIKRSYLEKLRQTSEKSKE